MSDIEIAMASLGMGEVLLAVGLIYVVYVVSRIGRIVTSPEMRALLRREEELQRAEAEEQAWHLCDFLNAKVTTYKEKEDGQRGTES